jgi:hypothetical protein
VDAVEGAAVAEPGDLLACGLDTSHLVVGDLVGEPAGDLDVGDGGGQAAGHGVAGQDHDAGVDGDVDWVGVAPAELGVDGVADLAEDEVGGVLPPGQGLQAGGDADPPGRDPGEGRVGGGAGAGFLDHGADGQLAGPPAGARLVAVDEQELADAVGGGGEQVAAEAEQVAVARVDAGDAAPAHGLHLVRDRDAGDGGTADVVVRDEEGARHRGQHADLVPGVREVWPDGRLDLADDLERACAHEGNAMAGGGPQVPDPRHRSHGANYSSPDSGPPTPQRLPSLTHHSKAHRPHVHRP